ncbi:hypothetical protein evm_002135 [Chilo suppressalis]|nr:hypothetical protein evm_002135 [Chilo suppressalis]
MVGVGVEGAPEYYGEYYPPEYFVSPDMCPHPHQHPQHAHMCTVHAEYGGMQVVPSTPMMPQLMPPVMDESLRHYLVPHPHPHHHPPHPQQHHQPPPHHQPPHHYGPSNGTGAPHFYGAGYPPHFHHVPPHMQHSPPPPVYQKDERTQRQYSKLKQKLERKQTNRNNGIEVNSGASTPSLSPRKELNGRGGDSGGASSGAYSEGEGSSAGASVQGDDDNATQAVLDMLSATRTPQVSDITPRSAFLQWNAPVPESVTVPNIDLTYDLLLSDKETKRYKAIYSGPSLSCRVRDLKPGCEYSVCLQIRAGELTGAASEAATFRAPAAPPDRMGPLRVTQRTRNSLQLRWNSVPDNGARLWYYLLETNLGEGFVELARPRTRQHTANNLRPQTQYRFRIAAVNECGQGEWSEDTVAWTTGSPPPAPAPPSLQSATADTLTLCWDRKSEEEFTLQMDDAARGHGFLPIYSGPERSYVCGGLRRATDYRFRLRCETGDGQGPWSTEVAYRTAPERPGAPGRPSPRGKIHSRAFRLRWEPPADDGGAPIASYTLELDGGEGYRPAYQGLDREAHCERLLPGTPYRARVRCANDVGDSDWSPAETVTTDASCPSACAAPEPAAAPRATLAALRWRVPDCTGGVPVTEYRLEVADADGAVRLAYQGPATECIVRDLTPGRPYRAWVTACNRVGAGPPSAALAFTAAASPPDALDAPLVTVETAHIARLEWTPPRNNGAPILDYRLEMSSTNAEDAFAEVYRGLETSCVVGELTPFSPYFFRVCASNSAGRGAWSGVRDVLTPRAPPAAPLGLRHEATADSLHLYWRTPVSHGADVLGYRVQVGDAAFDTDGPTPERLVEGLRPDTMYRVRVAALNELGLGAWSEEARAATRPMPPPPPHLKFAQAAHNFLKLEWASAGEGAQYCVEMRAADGREFRPVYRGSARSCKVKKLREASAYWFRIRASDERGGRGAWSEPAAGDTLAAPPPAPRPPALHLPAPRVAHIAWEAMEDAEYILQCARGKDAVFKQVYAGSETQFSLEELEAGAEYLVRVMAVRGGLGSAWSAAARLVVPAARARKRPGVGTTGTAAGPAAGAGAGGAASGAGARRTALLMAAAFLLLAVGVAVLLQRLVEPRP